MKYYLVMISSLIFSLITPKECYGQDGWKDLFFPKNNIIYNVVFRNADTGIVVGEGIGELTFDGGKTWHTLNTPFAVLSDAVFINDSIIIASGSSTSFPDCLPLILKSVDCGKTWRRTEPSYVGTAQDVDFPSDSVGYAVTYPSTTAHQKRQMSVLKSTDQGESWQRILKSGENDDRHGELIKFRDKNNGFLYSTQYEGKVELLFTSDGGNNWKEDSLTIFSEQKFEYGINPQTFMHIKDSTWVTYAAWIWYEDSLIRTTNDGKSWAPATYTSTFFQPLVGAMVDSTVQYLINVYKTERLYKSTDGGMYWQLIPTAYPYSAEARSVCFPTEKVGYMAVRSSSVDWALWKTTSGGEFSVVDSRVESQDVKIILLEDKLWVSLSPSVLAALRGADFILYNSLGAKVRRFTNQNSIRQSIDISSLPAGFYSICINNNLYSFVKSW